MVAWASWPQACIAPLVAATAVAGHLSGRSPDAAAARALLGAGARQEIRQLLDEYRRLRPLFRTRRPPSGWDCFEPVLEALVGILDSPAMSEESDLPLFRDLESASSSGLGRRAHSWSPTRLQPTSAHDVSRTSSTLRELQDSFR